MDLGIAGRRAVVAGASAGLGFAVAEALAAEGVTVAIGSRSEERIGAAAKQLGGDAVPLVVDLRSAEAGVDFVRRAAEALGAPPDIIVTNAGGPPKGGFDEAALDAYAPALDQNLMSAIGMCTAAIPDMREQRWGRIIAITSIAVKQPIPYLILSNVARTGLTGYLKSVATSVAPDGITVNSVLPGNHDTERVRQLYGSTGATDSTPMGRQGRPPDFGATVAFLASEQAGFITGATIPIDGGYYQGLL